ncbi:unnamed protein product [Tilletia controversa]|uniref:DDE Tnp4 domain-containing protein n=2 Tax=Tilletia TaxID=13289 RepID=A0A177VAF2_9BASI|nr:hypothetical protein CF335_g7961 [Tilletia laevis]KAE8242473.1 hypothetical protein A4X03_0g8024 [Tilletia caries]CAD6985284.1 unnamed protein product [Tilletia controversa]KAE8185580.1 hypothetical protein CF336_g7348 [Tilletia laevis]CAD6948550.1 unnamed protein product [Tilletia caries]
MFVKAPGSDAEVPERLRGDDRLRHFKAVLGAVDGVHVAAHPSAVDATRFRNRKAGLTFNVLAACGFDLSFHYILTGWEGSAADSHVFHAARTSTWLIPKGRTYLADAGFPLCVELLTPYRNTRYHLNEWGDGSETVTNKEELYNRRHSGLRSVIERAFGIMKARFKVLRTGSQFDLKVQAAVFPALAVVHNMLISDDPDDPYLLDDFALAEMEMDGTTDSTLRAAAGRISDAERKSGQDQRDKIARKMWRSFK